MELIPNIEGFHTNDIKTVNKFVSDKKLAISYDKEYLGEGMYFWDNLSNAEYWAKQRMSKKELKEAKICKANIILSNPFLDLTDKSTITQTRKLWNLYCDKMGEDRKNQFLGTILDILRGYFKEIDEMTVTKGHGNYSHWQTGVFFKGTRDRLDDRTKTIYSVRCSSKLANHSYVKNIKA